MLNSKIEVSCPQPEPATNTPAPSKAWVQRERTVNQRNRGLDISATRAKHECDIANGPRIFWGGVQSTASTVDR